jgi:ribosomal-protein-serine acetyltransferase
MLSHKVSDDVELKILDIRHAEELYQLIDKNRKHLRQWLGWLDGTTSSEHTLMFIQSTLKAFSENTGFNLGIFYRGKLAGCIGLNSIEWNHGKTTIGYWLAENYQGLGLMTRSCKALVDYAIGELSLNRVEIRAAEENWKSRAIPERLSFVKEGTIRQAEWLYDHYVDHVVYGLLKDDWKKLQ